MAKSVRTKTIHQTVVFSSRTDQKYLWTIIADRAIGEEILELTELWIRDQLARTNTFAFVAVLLQDIVGEPDSDRSLRMFDVWPCTFGLHSSTFAYATEMVFVNASWTME